MKRYFFILYLFLSLGLSVLVLTAAIAPAAFAEQGLLPTFANDTVINTLSIRRITAPASEYVPVLGPDYTSTDTLLRDSSCMKKHLTRAEKRACRAKEFAFKLDSLVELRDFTFYPTTMQAQPKGLLRMIYADFCYMLVSPMDMEVHLPVERGLSQYVTMLNFDTPGFSNYQAVKYQYEWRVSFSTQSQSDTYYFDMYISLITGETVLLLQSTQVSMRYVGTIGPRHRVE